MTKIDFYHWGCQCPWISATKELLAELKETTFQVQTFDIAEDHELAEKMNMFAPFLLVFNEQHRWNGPITKSQIRELARGKYPRKQPYEVNVSRVVVTGELRELTEDTVDDTLKVCGFSSRHGQDCQAKGRWIKVIREKYTLPHLGLLHYAEGKCVGGAEFVPSLEVPYPIPKNEKTAFLTCSFLSCELFDYRSFPLARLEEQLRRLGFHELIAVASERVVFPNGPLQWFLERKYQDLGSVYYEENDFARMHLVSKKLVD